MKIPLLLLVSCLLSVPSVGQTLDHQHFLLDASYSGDSPYAFRDFREAASHFADTTTLYIAPGVYWVDDPDNPEVVVGKDGREPFGMVIKAKILHFIGLDPDAHNIVLASQRGQTQGAVGNFTMFDFWCDSLYVENMTMGNFCNVDLDYPLNPSLSRPKRSDAITQAHVGYVHGQYLEAKNVRFISRLNLNPLNGANTSYYEDCHFECTDDAMNGTAVYRHCTVDLYGQKPFWSTFGKGAMFVDCDFNMKSDNKEMYFTKQGGPLTLIDCRYHAPSDSVYIGWTAYPQRWLRCYQQNFTLNGRPYIIGSRQPENTVLLSDYDSQRIPFLHINTKEAELVTSRSEIEDTLVLSSEEGVRWMVDSTASQHLKLIPMQDGQLGVVARNYSVETADLCVNALADDGRVAATHLKVRPQILWPPSYIDRQYLTVANGYASLHYKLMLHGARDESVVTWVRFVDGKPYTIAQSHDSPAVNYQLQPGDIGKMLLVQYRPKDNVSELGEPQSLLTEKIKRSQVRSTNTLETDFHDFPCDWQPEIIPGLWTVDGYKPADTAEFSWDFDRSKPMWEYAEGFNGAIGMGLLQKQRGARIMYTPVKKKYGDMSLTLEVDPTKTAGQGFGSATGQYMDVCLKFDPATLTGYGLRIIRTTKYAKAVDFLLIAYENGQTRPLSEPISSTCYRTGCTISLKSEGKRLTAHVETTTPRPSGSDLPHVVDLSADIVPNSYGGVAIQHTGSCGESTTMLHHLSVRW